MPDFLKKMTPSEVGRLGALARQGKYKAKKKEPKGRKKASPEEAAAAREAKRRQEAIDNRASVMDTFGSFGKQTLPDLEALASGKEITPENADGMVMAGLAEKLSTGQVVLSAQGKKLYNAASRGDVGAAKEAIDRAEASASDRMAKDKTKADKEAEKEAAAAEKEKAGGGGGGGGGKDKPKPEDKAKEKAAERAQTAADTAKRVGLTSDTLDALRAATEDAGEPDKELQRLGLQGADGLATDQGRRALVALERGNVATYRAALQDAAGRLDREGTSAQRRKDATDKAQARQAEKERRDAARLAEKERKEAERAVARRKMDRREALRVLGETQKAMSDELEIKQTAQDRAMFANMGGGSGGGGAGGGKGGGGKPSGGVGSLYAVNPATGKREPGQGLAKGAPPAPAGSARAEAAKPDAKKPKEDDGKPKPGTPWTPKDAHAALDAPGQRTMGFEGPSGRQAAITTNSAGRGQHTFSLSGGDKPQQSQQLTTAEARTALTQMHERGFQSRFGLDKPASPKADAPAAPQADAAPAAARPKKGDTIYPQGRKEFESRVVRRTAQGYYVRPVNARPGTMADNEFFVPNTQVQTSFKAVDMDDSADVLDEFVEAFGVESSDDAPLFTAALDALDGVTLALDAVAPATKAGRRNRASDQALINAIYQQACAICELAESLGAEDGMADDDEPEMVEAPSIKALGDDLLAFDGDAVKALGEGWVGGYLVKFSDPVKSGGDLTHYKDMFLPPPDTDYGSATKSDVYVHHRMLPGLGKKQLRNQADIGFDDAGVFIKHLLDLRDPYERALYTAAQQGKLGWSSGTAPHLVERKSLEDGRHIVAKWPLGLDASYTPTPAGGLEMTTAALKALSEAIDDSQEASDPEPVEAAPAGAVKAATDDRARRLLLQRRLLSLKETA